MIIPSQAQNSDLEDLQSVVTLLARLKIDLIKSICSVWVNSS